MGDTYRPPRRALGVDFSGANTNAGRKIWITETVAEDDCLRIESCRPATEAFDTRPERQHAVPALTAHLAELGGDWVVGLDFPFGLPRAIVPKRPWLDFLMSFPDWFSDPNDMRSRCQMHAELVSGGRKSKLCRATELPLGALSPYDVRLKKQTFYGLRDLIRPLVLTHTARVVPMQSPDSSMPTLLETYPAGTLDLLDLTPAGYKSTDASARDRRAENLDGLIEEGIDIDDGTAERILDDTAGDALDSVVAAFAAFRNTRDQSNLRTEDDRHVAEGYIYV